MRSRFARARGDDGAALVLVLIVITVIALGLSALLSFSDTSIRTTVGLRDQAAAQPLLLVLDDLQAADEGSILLLEFVATALPEMSALIVALGRPETARLDELERHATRMLRL